MALAVSIRFDFRDDKGKTSHTKIRVPNGFSIAQYTEFATAAAQIITNASFCIVTRASICVGIDLSGAGLKVAAALTSDIAHKAYMQFNTVAAGFRAKMRIPTLDEIYVIVGSDAIEQTHVNLSPYIAAMENGIAVTGPATIQPCDDRENDIVSTSIAREVFRKT